MVRCLRHIHGMIYICRICNYIQFLNIWTHHICIMNTSYMHYEHIILWHKIYSLFFSFCTYQDKSYPPDLPQRFQYSDISERCVPNPKTWYRWVWPTVLDGSYRYYWMTCPSVYCTASAVVIRCYQMIDDFLTMLWVMLQLQYCYSSRMRMFLTYRNDYCWFCCPTWKTMLQMMLHLTF